LKTVVGDLAAVARAVRETPLTRLVAAVQLAEIWIAPLHSRSVKEASCFPEVYSNREPAQNTREPAEEHEITSREQQRTSTKHERISRRTQDNQQRARENQQRNTYGISLMPL
jgi:hypothetical protein